MLYFYSFYFIFLFLIFFFFFFFFNDTATTEIYTLSLHDALPIYDPPQVQDINRKRIEILTKRLEKYQKLRSEEHTSELQSLRHLVCRLLLEKKKKKKKKKKIKKTNQTKTIIKK